MQNKIVEKIKKLLSLANSSNEYEARLAAERANELLVRNQLSMQDITRPTEDYGSKIIRDAFWAETEDKYVTSILRAHFFVEAFEHIGSERHPTARCRRRCLTFVGSKENVEIAEYVYHFLMMEFKFLWKAYKIESRSNERSRQSYYLGLFNGLQEQLTVRRKEVEREVGLMVVKDKGLEKYMCQNHSGVKSTKASVNDRDADARFAGFEKGKEMQIRRGLGEKQSMGKVLQINGRT